MDIVAIPMNLTRFKPCSEWLTDRDFVHLETISVSHARFAKLIKVINNDVKLLDIDGEKI